MPGGGLDEGGGLTVQLTVAFAESRKHIIHSYPHKLYFIVTKSTDLCKHSVLTLFTGSYQTL